jgi:O-antigen/teichoic acid export membrane protein
MKILAFLKKEDSFLSIVLGGTKQFRQNISRMATATIFSQLLGLLALPILSRAYSPQEFATLTSFTLMQGVCLAVITARFDWLLPNSETSSTAAEIYCYGVISILVGTLLIFSLIVAVGGGYGYSPDFLSGGSVIFYLPIGVLAGGMILMIQSRHVYMGDLSHMSLAKVAQAVTTIFLSLALGLTLFEKTGLVIAYVSGFVAALYLLRADVIYAAKVVFRTNLWLYFRALKHYHRQLVPSIGLSLVNILMNSSPLILIMFYYDSTILGWYGLVFRVAAAPVSVISMSLVHSFWSDASHLSKSDLPKLRQFYLSSITRLALLAAPLALISLSGPLYIPMLFGEEQWAGAGMLLAALTPYLVGMLIFSPTTHLIVYGKAHWQLWIDLITLLMVVVVFSWSAFSGLPAWKSIACASTVMFFGYIARFFAHLVANSKHEIMG